MSLTVSVAICNPNQLMFEKFLLSLKEHAPDMKELMVFDNGGADSHALMQTLNAIFPRGMGVSVQINNTDDGSNIGFGEAHNFNFSQSNGTYFAVVNDDVEWFENWTTPMLEKLKSDDRIAQVGMRTGVCSMLTPDANGMGVETDNPDYLEGSCFIIKRKAVTGEDFCNGVKVLFDAETFKFAYFEDTDLSLRLRKNGWKIANVKLKWVHHRAKTSTTVPVDIMGYHTMNKWNFQARWGAYLLKKKFGPTILVKREGSLGDVFLTTPVIREIRRIHGDNCMIALMTACPQTVLANPEIDLLLQTGTPFPCEIVIDLDSSYENDFRKHIIDAYAETVNDTCHHGLTICQPDRKGVVYIHEDDTKRINRILGDNPASFVVFEMSETKWPGKAWPYDRYTELGRRIRDLGYAIITVGVTHEEIKVPFTVNLANQLTPLQTAALIARAKAFIGHEGMLAHLAQALEVPSVVLYGMTKPEYVSNIESDKLICVCSPSKCHGCRHTKYAGTGSWCPRNGDCMNHISVDSVYNAFTLLPGVQA